MRMASTFSLLLARSLAALPAFASVDPSIGPLAPTASVQLVPAGDGILRYTGVDIAEGVVVSIDRSGFSGPVTLSATGDIRIAGALDGGGGVCTSRQPA